MKNSIKDRLSRNFTTAVKAVGVRLMLLCWVPSSVASAEMPQKVTYLYNSGWLIETWKEIILIDYVPNEKQQLDGFLFAQLSMGVAANKRAYILVTHEHSDHFYEPLLQWHYKMPGLVTILGWNYTTTDKSIIKVFGRDSLAIGSFKLISHPSTDAGSGFLLSIGDFTFYHGGDHAAWSNDMMPAFTEEIKFIKSQAREIDMIFIPIAQGRLGGCKATESMSKGVVLTLQLLKPKIAFPMHIQCENLESYKEFARQVKENFPAIVARFAECDNDVFRF